MMQRGTVELVFLLILSGTIGYCVYLLAQELQQQKQSPRSFRRRSYFPVRAAAPRHLRRRAAPGASRARHPLHGKLTKLLNGDAKSADRLIALYRRKFPDKPLQWHYEKAIYDLSRDRH